MIVHERCLDLMGTSRVPKLEPLVDIKKTLVFIDSSGAPHIAKHISSWIPLACMFFLTVMHPVTICHKKCFIFGGHRIFQQNVFSGATAGP